MADECVKFAGERAPTAKLAKQLQFEGLHRLATLRIVAVQLQIYRLLRVKPIAVDFDIADDFSAAEKSKPDISAQLHFELLVYRHVVQVRLENLYLPTAPEHRNVPIFAGKRRVIHEMGRVLGRELRSKSVFNSEPVFAGFEEGALGEPAGRENLERV